MSWIKNKKNIRILNTGGNLPEPSVEQELRFLADSDRFVGETIRMQSKKEGVVIYGAQAVNAIVGPVFSRPTNDYDVYSNSPKRHAIQLEKTIDKHTKSDMAFVEEVPFTNEKGKKGLMYRVGLKHFDTLADYNKKPVNLKTIKIRGVLYEHLDLAKKKYLKMINADETKRLINANQDLDRIWLYEYNKRMW